MAVSPILPFAQLLGRYRHERCLTQEALAEMAGLSARGIRALEKGERTTPHADTVRLLADALQLSPRDRMTFEAAARHLAISQAVGRDTAPPAGSFLGARPGGPLIAREEELGQILMTVGAVEQGEGRLVILTGEPGVGKTRLAQEVTVHIGNRGFALATGRCYEPEQVVPYYPFLDALTGALTAAPRPLRAAASSRWPYLGWLLPDVVDAPDASQALGQDAQQLLFRSVTGFVKAVAEIRPLALLLDDLHWADKASLQLFVHLARHTHTARILLLATYRDTEVGRKHPLTRALLDLGREGLAQQTALERLRAEGTAALIATTLGEAEVSGDLAALVHRRTDGNPFFVKQVLQGLMERGDLYQEDGRWEQKGVQEFQVPESIRSAIGSRLSRLSPEAQDLLRKASVLGQTFQFNDLQVMAARQEEVVEEALEEATEASLIWDSGRDGYSFDHALTQQTLYSELPRRKRRRLHLAAGETLEKLPEGLRARRAAELAGHFLQGEDQGRALRWSLLAGHQAEAMFAHAEAEHHYRTALELARQLAGGQPTPSVAEALERLGIVLSTVARYDEALTLLEEAATQHRQSLNVRGEMRVACEIGNAQWSRGTPREGVNQLEPMVERFEESGPSAELAACYACLERLYYGVGRYRDELVAAERASQLARREGDDRTLAVAEVGRGSALAMVGRPRESVHVLEDALPLTEKGGDTWTSDRILRKLGTGYLWLGELQRSQEYCERARTTAERFGNPFGIAYSLALLGELHTVLGKWQEARGYLSRSVDLARSVKPSAWGIYPFLSLGWLLVVSGHWKEARQMLEDAMAEYGGDPQARLHGTRSLAELDLAGGRPDVAVARLKPLLDRPSLEETEVAQLLPALAEAHLATGDLGRTEALLGEALNRAREQDLGLYLVDALRVQGMLRTAQARWDEAQSAFDEAFALAHTMPYPYAEGLILFEYGLLHIQRGELGQARGPLAGALELFQRLGASKDAERAEQALHNLR
jgi:tetratricopeptide (TPR) repeat protein/transcriptional regulator with XRE-family HTH domain